MFHPHRCERTNKARMSLFQWIISGINGTGPALQTIAGKQTENTGNPAEDFNR